MKKLVILCLSLLGCSSWSAKDTLEVVKIADQACIVMHQDLPDTDIARVCGVADHVVKAVVQPARIQSSQHAALAAMHAETVQCVAIEPLKTNKPKFKSK